jgi:hypothetical protein
MEILDTTIATASLRFTAVDGSPALADSVDVTYARCAEGPTGPRPHVDGDGGVADE